MRNSVARVFLSLLLVASVNLMMAAGPAVGLAVSSGAFQVDHAQVWTSATLFEGSMVETHLADSQLKLNNGARVRLLADSRAKVYPSRLVLEKGMGQLEGSSNYAIDAATLHISASEPNTVARLDLQGEKQVRVAVTKGAVSVTNSSGILVARLDAGKAIDFTAQEGAAGPTKVSGCVLKKGNALIIVDDVTKAVIEIQGFTGTVGSRYAISGGATSTTASVEGASQSIKVLSSTEVSKGGCASIAKEVGAAGAGAAGAGAAAAVGMAVGTKVAIIAGVAAAATVGGVAYYEVSKSPASR